MVPAAPLRVVVFLAPGACFDVRLLDGGARAVVVDAYVDGGWGGLPDTIGGIAVIGFDAWRERHRGVPCVLAPADPALRRSLDARVAAAGGTFASLHRTGGPVAPGVVIGEGALVGPGPLVIARATRIGRHVHVVTPATVGHDVDIGDFVTLHPSSHISGHVVVEDDVVLGVGAVVVPGTADKPLRIGRGATIETGAVVTKSVPAGAHVAGNPGRVLPRIAHLR
jgi:UDP-3-O-[3-hydroxymyristoyl] glucosamine N-acyltransferase